MSRKFVYIFLFSFIVLFFAGCGSKKELEEYKNNMDTFYSDISEYDNTINSIDADSETCVQELLSALDGIGERFSWMASLTVPEEFSSVEALSAQANESMTNAVALYHQAFESETFDSDAAASAKDYYNKANQNVREILSILHGSIPDGGEDYSDSAEKIDGMEPIPE